MIPEDPRLGELGETSISWFRQSQQHLDEQDKQDLTNLSKGIIFGVCTQEGNRLPTWGMIRYKTIDDLEKQHGKSIHLKKNWNGKSEGIQFENYYLYFYDSKTENQIEGVANLPIHITEENRCNGFFKHGGRCTRYDYSCNIKSHKEINA